MRRRSSLRPQVGALDFGIAAQRRRLVGEHDPAGLEHVAARRHVERVVRVLLDEQDRRALLVDLARPSRRSRSTRIGARPIEGSSSSSSFGSAISARPIASICCSPPDMRARLLLLAARAGAGTARARGPCRPRRWRRRRRYAPSSRFSRTVMRWKQRRPSGDCEMPSAHDLLRGQRGDLLAAEADRPLARRRQAGDRAQRRRLAGAVGADQRDDLALVDRRARSPFSASIEP